MTDTNIASKLNIDTLSVHTFMYDDGVPERVGKYEDILESVCALLMLLGFKTFLSGFKFLARLILNRITQKDYDKNKVIEDIANDYAVSERAVVNNITECVERNTQFNVRAARLLKKPILNITNADEAVETISAIYYIYYNYKLSN